MKRLLAILFLLLTLSCFGQLKISQYPNTGTLQSNYLFIVAAPGATNYNIAYGQLLSLLGTTGLGGFTNVFVNNAYITNLFLSPTYVTNIAAYSTNFYINDTTVSNYFFTNLFSNTSISNYFNTNQIFYVTNINSGKVTVITNTYITNFLTYATTVVSNLTLQEISTNSYVSNYFQTNIFNSFQQIFTNNTGSLSWAACQTNWFDPWNRVIVSNQCSGYWGWIDTNYNIYFPLRTAWVSNLIASGSYYGNITTGNVTNQSGSRVAYLSDVVGGISLADFLWKTNALTGGMTNAVNPINATGNLFANSITSTNGSTNQSLTASTLMSADINKAETSVANGTGFLHDNGSGTFAWQTDGSSLTNLTYDFDTNAIPASASLTFGHAYTTNLTRNITLPAFTINDSAFFSTIVLFVTNGDSADHTITLPAGTKGTPGSGTPPVYYFTNGQLTRMMVEHYGNTYTNAYVLPFAP